MRRLGAIALALLAAGLLIALPATGADDGPYRVRAIFDNGGFIVPGEEVRVAGARVGRVESVDVSGEEEIVSREGGDHAIPGKAVVVLAIDDDAFKDFRQDASCIIRPQSLIGEKLVDCTPTNPRAPGSPPPPELEEIPEGEAGAGQRLLPLENNGKSVDLDLIQNIQRAPYRDRFRLILNDLGAGLAARGDDLAAIVERANPALRQTDRVLNILAQQSKALADLAANGDTVLEPLAREKEHISGFIANANTAAQAAAERSDDLEAGLQRFPGFLRELRGTMRDLRFFADQGAPLFEDLEIAAPHLSKATQKLGPFASAGIPAFDTLGDAAQAAGPKLVAANPLLAEVASFAESASPVGRNLSPLLDTFMRTNGFKNLLDFIYFTVGNINGFDSFGHFQRANVQVTTCLNVNVFLVEGCDANFVLEEPVAKKKKKKKKKKGKKGSAKRRAVAPPQPPPIPGQLEDVPELQPTEPIEPIDPIEPEQPTAPGGGEPGAEPSQPGGSSSGEPGNAGAEQASAGGAGRAAGAPVSAAPEQMTFDQAGMLLRFLLGSGA
jgi:ABC-type transporter Mla subunit MlaD